LKELRYLYHVIEKLRDIKDNLTWIWEKISYPFKKIYGLFNR
jgi:hypothetical protein